MAGWHRVPLSQWRRPEAASPLASPPPPRALRRARAAAALALGPLAAASPPALRWRVS